MSSALPPGIPTPEDSKSFVVETILEGLLRSLPPDRRADLVSYLQAAATLDGSEALERQRGKLCDRWAVAAVAAGHDSEVGRLAARVMEEAKEVEEKIDAFLVDLEYDLLRRWGTPRGFHRELNQSFEALREANKLASRVGWDAVPWRALLDDLVTATADGS